MLAFSPPLASPTRQARPTLLPAWRVAIMLISLAGLFISQFALAAPVEINLPPSFTSGHLQVPAIMLDVARQALAGPQHDLLLIDYASANAANRSALSALTPAMATGFQITQTTPANAADSTLIAGPAWRLSIPIGQGQANINLGLQGLLAYTQNKPLASAVLPQANVKMNLPLLAGSDLRRDQADLELYTARASYQMQRRNLILKAISAYLALQQSDDELQLAGLSCALAQAEYDRAIETQLQGTLTSGELNRLRSYWQSTIDAQVAAQRTRTINSDQLQTLLGVAADSPLLQTALSGSSAALIELQTSVTPLPAELADWIQLALEKREDIAVTRAALKQAEDSAAKTRATTGKELNFTASLGWPREISLSKQDFRTELQVGLQGTFYLHNAACQESVTMADLAVERAMHQVQAKEMAVTQEVKLAFYDVESCWRALIRAQEQQAQDEILLATMRQRLQAGLAIALDVQSQELVTAQQAARVRRLQADLLRGQIALWHTAGLQIMQLGM